MEIMLACSGESGIDASMYEALCTRIDIDGLFDILEMRKSANSYKSAAQANADFAAGG